MDVRFLIIGLLFLAMGVYYICRMVKSGANCKIPAEATIVKVDLVKRRSGGKRKDTMCRWWSFMPEGSILREVRI